VLPIKHHHVQRDRLDEGARRPAYSLPLPMLVMKAEMRCGRVGQAWLW
jgi:hypothetical protein